MLRLLICEDEVLERKAIRFLVNKFYRHSVAVVGETANGQDAVDLAARFQPDIILMDIQMPGMNGLEAGAAIRNACRETEIVILTAFSYFDYAQKSISLGVSDYLLKPYSNEEFCCAMDKVIDRVRVKAANRNETDEMRRKFEKMIPFVEKEMVTNIVYGVVLTQEKFESYKKLLDITGEKFCCMIFRDEKGSVDFGIQQELKEQLKLLFSAAVGCVCLDDFVVFPFDGALEEKMLGGRFEKMIRNMKAVYAQQRGTALQFGMGCCNEKVGELFVSYNQARLAIDKAQKNTNVTQNPNTLMFDPRLKEIIMGISAGIINEDQDGALLETDRLLGVLSSGSASDTGATAKKSFKAVLNNVMEFLGEDCKNFDRVILNDMDRWNSAADIRCSGHMIVKNLTRFVTCYKKNRNIDTVGKVKKYLESNYMRDISLDDMAEYVSISSYYLSRIFKKVEGVNFKDYLIRIRMEKAKNMLKRGDQSVKQVGISVGYSDQDYFSKAFKKYTNFSPKEYMSS